MHTERKSLHGWSYHFCWFFVCLTGLSWMVLDGPGRTKHYEHRLDVDKGGTPRCNPALLTGFH